MTEDEAEILEEFIQESREHLAAIEPDLLEMERLGTKTASDIVNRVFRAIHSMKGGAAFLAFESLKEFSHVMENVLMLIRDGKLAISPTVVDALLRGVDVLSRMIDDVRASDTVDGSAERATLEAIIRASTSPPQDKAKGAAAEQSASAKVAVAPPPSESAPKVQKTASASVDGASAAEVEQLNAAILAAIAHGNRIYRFELDEAIDLAGRSRTREQFLTACSSLGKVLIHRVETPATGTGQGGQTLVFALASVLDKRMLLGELDLPETRLQVLDKGELLSAGGAPASLLRMGGGQKPAAGSGTGVGSAVTQAVVSPPIVDAGPVSAARDVDVAPNATKPSVTAALTKVVQGPGSSAKEGGSEAVETLRVRVELLNRLMDSASELVLGRNQLLRALKDQADKSTGLGIILQHIDRVTTDLQEGIMQTRMQQIGSLFSRYGRVARDLGRQLGKNVELRSEGNHVELDKSIIEALADPLTHIVRNAVDHAIETPEERRKKKKPEVGKILLSASHESGQVKIVVEDDGRGIDRDKVLRKAIEKGLVTSSAAEKLTERDVMNLLMLPGFSTADRVSDLSGRGVGMDVVRTNVESLGGLIEIESEFGFGTSVQLRLPLTLAIIASLIVGAGGTRFAIPQASIVELVWVRSDDEEDRVQSLQGALTLRLRGRLLPLIRVSDVLGGVTAREESQELIDGKQGKDYYILVLRAGADSYGLIVDELFESEEIVVKPLPQFLKGIDCFAGTTILGDGSVTMILDASGLAVRAGLRFATASAEAAAAEVARAAAATKRSVILFAGSATEQYLVAQEQVLRLERIERSHLQRAGGRDYVCYRGQGLPLIRLEEFLPVSGVPDIAEEMYLLIPRMVPGRAVEPAAGILVWRILDAVDLELTFEDPLFEGPGVTGVTLIDGVLTTLLDPVALARAAQPRKGRAA